MPQSLYVFNPEHDLALANGDAHYVPPASALQFAEQCAWILAWIYRKGYLLTEQNIPDSYLEMCQQLEINIIPIKRSELSKISVNEIIPWGWDLKLVTHLHPFVSDPQCLLSDEILANILQWSHRMTSVQAHKYLRGHLTDVSRVAIPATSCLCVEETERFLAENQDIILKMPLSGSGRGLRRCKDVFTLHQKGWILNTIKRQGMIMVEKRYEVVADFAMEFVCEKSASFLGYSLFNTHNGVYDGNILLSDDDIERFVAQYVSIELLHQCRELLLAYFSTQFAGYKGFLGVDMFVYQENGQYFLHPMVEINVRTTMGVLARKFYDYNISENTKGVMKMIYFSDNKSLINYANRMSQENPLRICNKKYISGFMPLVPVSKHLNYLIYTNISNLQ